MIFFVNVLVGTREGEIIIIHISELEKCLECQ